MLRSAAESESKQGTTEAAEENMGERECLSLCQRERVSAGFAGQRSLLLLLEKEEEEVVAQLGLQRTLGM